MKSYFFSGISASLRYLKRRLILGVINGIALHPSFRPVQDLQCALLRLLDVKVGVNVQLSESFFLINPGQLFLGDGCRIGTHCKIYNFSPITIGKNLLASHGLTLISGTHDVRTLADRKGPILIGDNVWIGINVTVVGPVRIGNNVVIGAGAVVLKDIPDDTIAAGVPAKVLRQKNKGEAND